MWVIVPVKSFSNAKLRLADVLSPSQRSKLGYLMLDDILKTLSSSDEVTGVTVISSDESARSLTEKYAVKLLKTDSDSGYSEDAMLALAAVSQESSDNIAIIPADVPQLNHDDLLQLKKAHRKGLSLCPAIVDGGTNAMLFELPLTIPLMFGIDSLEKYRSAAIKNNLTVTIHTIPGLQHDIDRPEDLEWLRKQDSGGQAWSYIRMLEL
jgi:2-phospho-L-lactate/phosphoenolpyruvate guanylyltransferase